ncbi:MAG: ribosome biogenesis factor YjgA [Nannocystaceae bacterium]
MIEPGEDGGDDDDDARRRPSHRETAARMKAIALLARALVGLDRSALAHVPLPEAVAAEVVFCQSLRKNALARQLRRIAGLLRGIELAPIEAAMHELETGRGERSRREQVYEHWRTRLLTEGDGAMTAFVAAFPDADVQGLRQRVRLATREPQSARGKGASRELLRAIRALGEADSAAAPPDEDEPEAV